MKKFVEILLPTLSGISVFALVTLRYCLMLFNLTLLILVLIAYISLIVFLIWITI